MSKSTTEESAFAEMTKLGLSIGDYVEVEPGYYFKVVLRNGQPMLRSKPDFYPLSNLKLKGWKKVDRLDFSD
jgi:secreted PhoX family phosphatase